MSNTKRSRRREKKDIKGRSKDGRNGINFIEYSKKEIYPESPHFTRH